MALGCKESFAARLCEDVSGEPLVLALSALHARDDDAVAKTEELYHRLMLGEDAPTLEQHWDRRALSGLSGSIEELAGSLEEIALLFLDMVLKQRAVHFSASGCRAAARSASRRSTTSCSTVPSKASVLPSSVFSSGR